MEYESILGIAGLGGRVAGDRHKLTRRHDVIIVSRTDRRIPTFGREGFVLVDEFVEETALIESRP